VGVGGLPPPHEKVELLRLVAQAGEVRPGSGHLGPGIPVGPSGSNNVQTLRRHISAQPPNGINIINL